MEQIELVGVSKSFGEERILDHLNLSIIEDEFLTLLGPSGCGKTTTLRIIGGFTEPDEGQVLFHGKDMTHLEAHERPVNTVFQQYALFPHLNVFDNVAFGLTMKRLPKAEIRQRVDAMLELLDLSGFQKRTIDRLSGGQQQRIAIARALVNEPEVLLLDEPLAALDAKLRHDMQIELKRIQKETGVTFVFVTHDQEEALTMSDRIVVMNQGHIQQIGRPIDIYNEPVNRFVADFIGASNIAEGVMEAADCVAFSGHAFTCVKEDFTPGERVDVVIRPEDVELVPPREGMLQGEVLTSLFKGVHYEMRIRVGDEIYLAQSTKTQPIGATVGIYIDPENIQNMHKSDLPHNNPSRSTSLRDRLIFGEEGEVQA